MNRIFSTLRNLRNSLALLGKSNQGLRIRMRQFQMLAENTSDLICQIDNDGVLAYVSPSAQALLGRDAQSLLGTSWVELAHPGDVDAIRLALRAAATEPITLRYRLRHQDGSMLWVESALRCHNQDVQSIVAVTRDIGERRRIEDNLRQIARLDSLTGLPNRLNLTERIDANILRASRDGGRFALVMLDLDRFKYVNDSLGHGAGDGLLCEAGARLQAAVRPSDVLARWSGDEFVLLISRLRDRAQAEELTRACMAALAAPFEVRGRTLHVGACAGIVVSPEDGRTETELLRNADMALHRAKENGAGSIVCFSADLAERARQRLALENALHDALRKQQFELRYQPIVDARSQRIVGAEALIRWRQGDRLVSPDLFIPIAEESGLIVPIGTWVLQQATATTQKLIDEGLARADFYVSVNVSARQFRDADFAALVQHTLAAAGTAPGCLQLELTESAIMASPATAVTAMLGIRRLGVSIAIDDFGTGYSSLAYLVRFPATGLKIDKSFVSGMSQGNAGATIVKATIAIAHELRMNVTAEGVETEEQRDILTALGCERLQGYLFAQPLTAAQLRTRLMAQALELCRTPAEHPAISSGTPA